jgi:hypothetical protein
MAVGFRRFNLVRHRDITGVSGTGVVAEGVQYSTGKVAVCWLGLFSSVVVWDSIEDAVRVHGHGGATEVEWIDE